MNKLIKFFELIIQIVTNVTFLNKKICKKEVADFNLRNVVEAYSSILAESSNQRSSFCSILFKIC